MEYNLLYQVVEKVSDMFFTTNFEIIPPLAGSNFASIKIQSYFTNTRLIGKRSVGFIISAIDGTTGQCLCVLESGTISVSGMLRGKNKQKFMNGTIPFDNISTTTEPDTSDLDGQISDAAQALRKDVILNNTVNQMDVEFVNNLKVLRNRAVISKLNIEKLAKLKITIKHYLK